MWHLEIHKKKEDVESEVKTNPKLWMRLTPMRRVFNINFYGVEKMNRIRSQSSIPNNS